MRVRGRGRRWSGNGGEPLRASCVGCNKATVAEATKPARRAGPIDSDLLHFRHVEGRCGTPLRSVSSLAFGAYTLQIVATYAGGVTGTSPGVTISVSNSKQGCAIRALPPAPQAMFTLD